MNAFKTYASSSFSLFTWEPDNIAEEKDDMYRYWSQMQVAVMRLLFRVYVRLTNDILLCWNL